jgi:hypothetical protein
MGRFAPETIEQVAAATDIVELIGTYFPLKRAGTEFSALCPFRRKDTLVLRQPVQTNVLLLRLRRRRVGVPVPHAV